MGTIIFYLDSRESEFISKSAKKSKKIIVGLAALRSKREYDLIDFLKKSYKDTTPDHRKIAIISQLTNAINLMAPHDKIFGIFPVDYNIYLGNANGLAKALIKEKLITETKKTFTWNRTGDDQFTLRKDKFLSLLVYSNLLAQIAIEIQQDIQKVEKVTSYRISKIKMFIDRLPFDPGFWNHMLQLFPLAFQMEKTRSNLQSFLDVQLQQIEEADKNSPEMNLADWITALSYNKIVGLSEKRTQLEDPSVKFIDSFVSLLPQWITEIRIPDAL